MAVLNVRDLLLARVGVPVTVRDRSSLLGDIPPFTVAGAEVVRGNPARIGFTLVNTGSLVATVQPRRAPVAGVGIRIEPNGGALIVNWEEDGEVVAWPWFGTATGGNSDAWLLETLIDAGPAGER